MEKIWNRLKNINWRALVPKVENLGPKLRFVGLRLLHPDRRLVVFIHDFFAMMLSLQLAFGIYYGDNLIYFSPYFITKQM